MDFAVLMGTEYLLVAVGGGNPAGLREEFIFEIGLFAVDCALGTGPLEILSGNLKILGGHTVCRAAVIGVR